MRVLMLDVDGLQPAYLGPYGCEWVPTPTLDRLAAAGVVFDQHFADCPDPMASGWRSGRHAFAPAQATTDLLADMRAAGVRTARVGAGPSRGWEIQISGEGDSDRIPLRRAVRDAIEKLGDAANAFLRVETDAVLPPWPPADEALGDALGDGDDDFEPWIGELPLRIDPNDDETFGRLQWSYAAAVATFDGLLRKLLVDCGKRGWGDDALWILTASRGFPLGEHGAVGFTEADVYEELIHLPLMLCFPSGEHAGMRVGGLTQPADVAATLRQVFGLETKMAGDTWMGRSLIDAASVAAPAFRERMLTGLRRGEKATWGYRTPDWYLKLDDQPAGNRRLFVKPDDRWEVNDIEPRNQELEEEMEKELRAHLTPGQ
jgi:arylsulfatase A-like enzyme